MPLTIEEVRRIATLARLELSPAEESKFAAQLGRIVEYIDQLRAFEIAPLEAEMAAPPAPDVPGDCLPWAAVVGNAPEVLQTFFVVPQVKGEDG